MTKNPIVNAVSAFLYIVVLALVMSWGTKNMQRPDTYLAPMVALSVFTLSAAFMGYAICLKPLTLYLDGKKKAAIKLFLQTILSFGIITTTLMFLYFGGIIK